MVLLSSCLSLGIIVCYCNSVLIEDYPKLREHGYCVT